MDEPVPIRLVVIPLQVGILECDSAGDARKPSSA